MTAKIDKNISGIKRIKETLIESEQKYRLLFEESNDAIFIADPLTRRLVDCNRKAIEMTGYSRRELLSMRADRLHPPDAKNIAMECFKNLASGKITTVDLDFMAKDGKRVPVSICGTPFRVGKKSLIMGIFRDIRERKMAEEKLRGSEEMFRAIAERSKVGIGMSQGRTIMYVNKYFAGMFGYEVSEVIGSTFNKFVAPCDRELLISRAQKRLRGIAAPEQYEVRGVKKDGTLIDVEINSGPAVNIDGVPTIITAFRDVTERNRIEDALRESENKYRLLFEESNDAIFVADTRTRKLIDCNKKAVEMTGYTKRKILSMRADELHPRELASQTMEGFKKQVRGMIRSLDSQLLARYKRRIDVSISATLLKIGGRELLLGVFRDITERKKAEEVLNRDAVELRQLVRARTEELVRSHDELFKAKRLSDIGLLAATVAHELRSPLAAIRTAAYNIKMKSRDRRLKSHLANIDKKILESDQIIKNLLYYSSIKPPQYEIIAFRRLLNECVKLVKQVYPERKVYIRTIYNCGRNLTIKADPLQLKEVFNNLLNNAYESLGEKYGKIEIKAWTDKGYLRVRIKDNGHGVKPGDMKNIFEPFFTTKAKGMGLGLTLCSQIVSLHNGNIKLSSRQGKGAAVTVSLPLNSKVEKSQKKVA